MNYLFGKCKKSLYYFSLFKITNLITFSKIVISSASILLKLANIKGLETFQDRGLIYNNLINLAL